MADISLQYLDQPLNNVSIAYQNDDFFGEKLFPVVPVRERSGRYWVFAKEKFRLYETIRAPKSEAREIAPWTLSNNAYYCDDHSLKDTISDEERAASQDTDLEINTVENLTDAILLDLENRIKNLILANAGGLAFNVTLGSGTIWSDYVNSDPVAAVEQQKTLIKQQIARTPNTFAVSYPVYAALRQHPKIIDRFKYTQVGILSPDNLKSVFDVDNFWVLGAEYDTANEGQSPSLNFVWQNATGQNLALLAYIDPKGPGRRTIMPGMTFRWTFGAPDLQGVLTKRYRVEAKQADVIEVHRYDDVELTVPQAIGLWQNAA
jgi:hypothetical protein